MIRLKAPARICLFGEHQDYLNYPVIAMAISKYIYLEASRISDQQFIIELPNINDELEIQLNNKVLEYNSKRDYLRSGYNQFLRKGVRFNKGYSIKITGDIPINAGAASSSAFVVAWLSFLNLIFLGAVRFLSFDTSEQMLKNTFWSKYLVISMVLGICSWVLLPALEILVFDRKKRKKRPGKKDIGGDKGH